MISDRYVTPAELAEHLQVSAEFVKAKARLGEWPCSLLGERTIRFSSDHIAMIESLIERRPVAETRISRRARTDHVKRLLKSSRRELE